MEEKPNGITFKNIKNALSFVCSEAVTFKTEELDFSQNSVIVVTAAGTIYGTPCLDMSKADTINGKFLSMLYNQALRSITPNESGYCLVLKDAVLISNMNFKQTFNTLFVFPEDIIAITVGNASNI